MSMQLLINPSSMTVADRERLSQILDLFAVVKPTITAATAPAVPLAAEDNPAAGIEQPSATVAFAAQPAPAVAFGIDPNLNPPGVAANMSSAPGPAFASTPAVSPAGATPAATNANVAGVEVDKNGLPWDARIHAETRSKNKDQSWRYKRFVGDDVIASVEAELRQLAGIASPNAAVAASPVAPAPVAPIAAITPPVVPELGNVPSVVTPPPPPAQPSPSIAPAPSAPSPVAPPSAPVVGTPTSVESVNPAQPSPGTAPGVSNFVEFVAKLMPLLQSGRLTQDELKSACNQHGLQALEFLAGKQELVSAVNASVDAILMTKG